MRKLVCGATTSSSYSAQSNQIHEQPW